MFPIKSLIVVAAALVLASHGFSAESSALAKLQGKWSTKRTAGDGQEVTAIIEIKGEKLIYQMVNSDKEVRFFAKGDVKAEKLGPFNVLKLTALEAGGSANDTRAIDDDRQTIYVLNEGTLTLASNFDKERENQKPSVEVYKRVEGAAAAVTPAPADGVVGKWKVTVKLGEDDREYEMNLAEAAGKLSGVMISPRSGEHKFKTVTYTNGKLLMELPRTIEENEVTFVYTGELKGTELSGNVIVKGFEDQFKGTWTAKR
jgi:hypothetical protein